MKVFKVVGILEGLKEKKKNGSRMKKMPSSRKFLAMTMIPHYLTMSILIPDSSGSEVFSPR